MRVGFKKVHYLWLSNELFSSSKRLEVLFAFLQGNNSTRVAFLIVAGVVSCVETS